MLPALKATHIIFYGWRTLQCAGIRSEKRRHFSFFPPTCQKKNNQTAGAADLIGTFFFQKWSVMYVSYVCNLVILIRNYVWFCHFYFSLVWHKLSSRIFFSSYKEEKHQNVMTKHVLLLHDLELWPMSRSNFTPKIKVIGQMVQIGELVQTGKQTNWCYQMHYLPALRSILMSIVKKCLTALDTYASECLDFW